MGQLIRDSVFETNSSSTHSITVGSKTDFDTIIPDYNGIIQVPVANFGWDVDDFFDPEYRLAYTLLYVRDWVSDKIEQQKFKDILYTMVLDHTGASQIDFNFVVDPDDYLYKEGYIDHQSVEDKDLHYLFENPVLLKAFIFGKGGLVHTDNDNY